MGQWYTFWPARGTGGVEDEERMRCVDGARAGEQLTRPQGTSSCRRTAHRHLCGELVVCCGDAGLKQTTSVKKKNSTSPKLIPKTEKAALRVGGDPWN